MFALHKAVDSGMDVTVLLSVIPHYDYSMLFHRPLFGVLSAQARALGITLESAGLSDPSRETDTLKALVGRAIRRYGINVLISGALRSRFQRRVFENVAREFGVDLYSPHWGLDDYEYMKSLLNYGIKFAVVSITSMGIPHGILGRVFTLEDLERLHHLSVKYGFNLSFEGGEAETLVLDAPLFRQRLEVMGDLQRISDCEAYFKIKKWRLVKKY